MGRGVGVGGVHASGLGGRSQDCFHMFSANIFVH